MKVVYNSPNRAHHYKYAQELDRAGVLAKFVSGFPRFGPGKELPVKQPSTMARRDLLQMVYLALNRSGINALALPAAHLAKIDLDRSSSKWARQADLFLFYPGAGLSTLRKLKGTKVRSVSEQVTSDVRNYTAIMEEESRICKCAPPVLYKPEIQRRIAETDEADFIVCPSSYSRRTLIENGRDERTVFVNHYGWPAIAVKQIERSASGEFTILFVGQVNLRKGLRYLLEAFARFEHPRKKLKIVGPLAAPTGIEGLPMPANVEFTGALKGEALEQCYREASVFVLPSIEDGFGLVLGEAMSAGVPIIATENSGGPDLIEEGVHGFIVGIRDPEAIALRLQQLADSPELLASMREACLARASSLSGWQKSGEELVGVLEQIHGAARD